tara:strand:- start:9422 stop:10300 length:879 start_codon:yes stop_codon:yes gene_type:complete
MDIEKNNCKICKSKNLKSYVHTAKCTTCGVLLYYPYPDDDKTLLRKGKNKKWDNQKSDQEAVLIHYSRSSKNNHSLFTHAISYLIDSDERYNPIKILDFGGGGGQFGLICKSIYPMSEVFLTDINDNLLLDHNRSINTQIKQKDFEKSSIIFDYIFLNDVFEHVSDPKDTISLLAKKLKRGGKIFIDTPRQFWLYPFTRIFFKKSIYKKLLFGTVSKNHLQIWTKNSFKMCIDNSILDLKKYDELSEYTMPPKYYTENMGITNPILILLSHIFYTFSRFIAKNKILAVLEKK